VLNGRIVENLHVDMARRLIARAAVIAARDGAPEGAAERAPEKRRAAH
jgi:hypothetical protein